MTYPRGTPSGKKIVYNFFALLPFLGIFPLMLLAYYDLLDANWAWVLVLTFVGGGILIQIFLGKRWRIED